jgi:hypothetical protein
MEMNEKITANTAGIDNERAYSIQSRGENEIHLNLQGEKEKVITINVSKAVQAGQSDFFCKKEMNLNERMKTKRMKEVITWHSEPHRRCRY